MYKGGYWYLGDTRHRFYGKVITFAKPIIDQRGATAFDQSNNVSIDQNI